MESYITEYMELPKTINLPLETEINPELIKKLIKISEKNTERYNILQEYYEGKAKINERSKDEYKANNKLSLNYPSYIVDLLLGMFVGKPISYTVAEENKDIMAAIQEVFDMNDEQDENTEIAKMAGIKGRGYEIVYLDEEGQIKFNEVEPENIVMVYDNKIKPEPLYSLYVRDDVNVDNLESDKKDKLITVYSKDFIKEYVSRGGDISLIDEQPNLFGEIPVIEFLNNDESIGDFERVLSLIDAINLSQSDTSNDFQEFTDALLVLSGMPQTDAEDVDNMMKDKVILLDRADGQAAQWLIKTINDTALENYKNRLDSDIHKFAKVPNLSDEHFAGNVSGESLRHAC
ncbi:phage portal protein [Peptoniphilus sp. GNH]|nr:phage portal protein [Peptoniphilus sp. GNH]